MMNLSVNEIATLTQAEIIGDPSFTVSGVSSFEDARSTDITFACDAKFLTRLEQTKAGVIFVPDTFSIEQRSGYKGIFLKTENPKFSFFKLVSSVYPAKKYPCRIHSHATVGQGVEIGSHPVIESGVFVGDHVTLGDHVHLMPNVFIGDGTCIGSHTLIKPNVSIMERSHIGSHVLIHSGTVIGSDGFGFTQNSGKHEKIIHTGYVHIGDHVEIGACNTIDRGTLGTTVIGNGVKTDNLVHIAHNVKIGDNSLIVAQVGIAGSATVGKNVIIAGKAGISGHITIGDGSIVGPYAGVHSDVAENDIVSGIPQMPHGRWRKVVSIISRLPEMRKKLFSFEKRLKALENKNE
jgi:UDP-3-O-[3-hydroxymyristoyl] glucosamine N-acyltransferase